MPVNIGELEARITTPGYAAGVRAIRDMNAEGSKAGATFDRTERAGGKLSGRMAALAGAAAGFAASIGVGALQGALSGVTGLIGTSIDAATRYNTSLSVLASTAKILGVPLVVLEQQSAGIQKSLGLSATSANTFVATAARMTAQAGQLNQTGSFLTAWLNLAASRGLTAAEAMQALETTINGQDEGLNRLGLANPSGIYEKWAASLGTTAGKMTDNQKALSIFNEVTQQASLVGDAYAQRLGSQAGASERLQAAQDGLALALGQAVLGQSNANTVADAAIGVLTALTGFVNQNRAAITTLVAEGAGFVKWLADVVTWGAKAAPYFAMAANLATGDVVGALRNVRGVVRPAPGAASAAAPGAADPFADPTMTPERAKAMEAAYRQQAAAQRAAAAKAGAAARAAAAKRAAAERAQVDAAAARASNDLGDRGLSPLSANAAAAAALGAGLGAPMTMTVPVIVAPKIEAPAFLAELQRFYEDAGNTISGGMAQGLSASIQAGVQSAFDGGGVVGAIAAFGKTMLGAVGGIFIQLGEQYLLYGGIMQALSALLPNPFTAGVAGLAIGAALIALGAALGGVASGSKKGGGGGAGGGGGPSGPVVQDLTQKTTLAPRAAPGAAQGAAGMQTTGVEAGRAVVMPVTLLNPNDPASQRLLSTALSGAQRRGIG